MRTYQMKSINKEIEIIKETNGNSMEKKKQKNLNKNVCSGVQQM